MTTSHEGHRARLRERFVGSGLPAFHDHEVLELLLGYAIPRRDVKAIAKSLLSEFHTLAAVFDASREDLVRIDGIGERAAVLIRLIPRLLERYQQDRWGDTESISSTSDAVAYLRSLLSTEREEVFYLLALNSRNALIAREALGGGGGNRPGTRLVAREQLQRGTVNRAAVFPRLVVEAALKHRATAVILAHNHPGGDCRPSSADRQLTLKLKKILSDLDIALHDHIIIAGPDKSYSFAQQGELL
jgi:DNA repair protein RadC